MAQRSAGAPPALRGRRSAPIATSFTIVGKCFVAAKLGPGGITEAQIEANKRNGATPHGPFAAVFRMLAMTPLQRWLLSAQVILQLLRAGQPGAALKYVLSPISSPIRGALIARPLRALKLARWVPGALGAGLLGYAVAAATPSGLVDVLRHAALALAGLFLLALSTALVLLPGPIWRSYVATWCRFALRGLVLCLLLGVTTALAPRASLTGALLVALTLWIGGTGLIEHLIDCLLWRRRHRVAGSSAALGADRDELTEQQQSAVCVHEAGHLMLFGLLTRIPEDAFAMVDRKPIFEFAGFVTPMRDINPIDMSPGLLRWEGMVALAGAAAEQLVVGHYTEGATADLDAAEKALRRLAALDYAQPYFRVPANVGEEAHNAAALAALRVELFDDALRYLAANRAQLDRVTAHLAAHSAMDCLEFAPIWTDAVTPSGFKRINPPSHIACLPPTESYQ